MPVTPAATPKTQSVQLKQPPKWLKRPCGANFGFGGKLVTFEATKQPNQPTKSVIKLGSVVTEESLLKRSVKLETSLQNGNLTEFCDDKLSSEDNAGDKKVWEYIKVHGFKVDIFKGLNRLSLTTSRELQETTKSLYY